MINYKNSNEILLNLLGIIKRAGKMISGESIVLDAIRNNKVKYVFIASDTGKSTAKKFNNKCKFYQVPVYDELSKDDLSTAIGQNRTIVGVTDNGFARKINELIK